MLNCSVAGSPQKLCQKEEISQALKTVQSLNSGRIAKTKAIQSIMILLPLLGETLFTPISRTIGLPEEFAWFSGVLLTCWVIVRIAINVYTHVRFYLLAPPVALTSEQLKLLGLSPTDAAVKTLKPTDSTKHAARFIYTPWPWMARRTSYQPNTSSLMLSSLNITGINCSGLSAQSSCNSSVLSTSADSFTWHGYGGGAQQLNSTPLNPTGDSASRARKRILNTSNSVNLEDSILDETSLKEFLAEHSFNTETNNRWGSADDSRSSPLYVSELSGGYQLSTRSPQTPATRTTDSATFTHPSATDDIWRRLAVPDLKLERWTENLRHWLCITVMRPLVKEIDSLNDQLRRLGYADTMLIGEASVTSLKQLSMTKTAQLPTLNSLLPFLDTPAPQDYLVNRIKELSRGRCMSDFNWSAGGVYKAKAWEDHLPTDSSLVMHVLCRYLDNRLPALPYPLGSPPFSEHHFLSTPQKPDLTKTDQTLIYQSCINPPCFEVAVGNEVWKPHQGRNNIFHSILLFLYMIKTRESNLLGPVKLGRAGINILWVLDL